MVNNLPRIQFGGEWWKGCHPEAGSGFRSAQTANCQLPTASGFPIFKVVGKIGGEPVDLATPCGVPAIFIFSF